MIFTKFTLEDVHPSHCWTLPSRAKALASPLLQSRPLRGPLPRPDVPPLPGSTHTWSFAPGSARHFLMPAPLSRGDSGTRRVRSPERATPTRVRRAAGPGRARGGLRGAGGGTRRGERGVAGPGRGRSRAGRARAAVSFEPPPPSLPGLRSHALWTHRLVWLVPFSRAICIFL